MRDRLGKLIQVYRPNTAAGVTVAVLVCLAGVGVSIYCLLHRPYAFKIMLAGVALVVAGPVLAAVCLFNSRRSLEVRRHGVRLIEGQHVTELAWDEITKVEANRTDVTGLGVATIRTRRLDLRTSCGR